MSTQQQDLAAPSGKTTVTVVYMGFPQTYPPLPCRITIYTATGARHPVMARIEKKTTGDWAPHGEGLVNDYQIGLDARNHDESLRFTFDCPAPDQFWEIHIQTPEFVPFPNFLDSLIGSCEPRAFMIAYPGGISRLVPPPRSEAEVVAGYVAKPPAANGSSATA